MWLDDRYLHLYSETISHNIILFLLTIFLIVFKFYCKLNSYELRSLFLMSMMLKIDSCFSKISVRTLLSPPRGVDGWFWFDWRVCRSFDPSIFPLAPLFFFIVAVAASTLFNLSSSILLCSLAKSSSTSFCRSDGRIYFEVVFPGTTYKNFMC